MMEKLSIDELLKISLNIAFGVSDYVKRLLDEKVKLHTHLERINISGDSMTLFDDMVNAKVLNILKDVKAIHPLLIISEETGVEVIGTGKPKYFIILDPVDGSNNIRPFFTPSPNITLSLALGYMNDFEDRGNPDAISVSIHKEIFSQKIYYALSGRGAFFQDGNFTVPIQVSPIDNIKEKCVIGIDFDNRKQMSHGLQNLVSSHIIQRRLGSSHLDLCQVACGQYDAYISDAGRLKVTDVCQSYHLVKEAGGIYVFQAFIDGKRVPEYHSDFLKRVIEEDKILKDLKFKVIAAGTHSLFEEVSGFIA